MGRLELIAGAALPAAVALAVAASGTGSERGEVEVLLTRSGPGSASVGLDAAADPAAEVPIRAVGSILLTLKRIELKRLGSGASDAETAPGADRTGEKGRGWVAVALSGDGRVDLVNLPADGRTRIAGGRVPAARYAGVRLVCAGPAVLTLVEDVALPGAEVLSSGEYELSIPGCEASGLVVPGATFRVDRDGEGAVLVEFRADASIRTLTWTGQRFLASPATFAAGAGAVRP